VLFRDLIAFSPLNGGAHLARRHAKTPAKNSMEMGYRRKPAFLANVHTAFMKAMGRRKSFPSAVEAPFGQFIGE
jgi:hypothetical protein